MERATVARDGDSRTARDGAKWPLEWGLQSLAEQLMASQKLTNCCVAAIALAASTYISTPHCSTIARLSFGAFCLAIGYFAFLRKHQQLPAIFDGGAAVQSGRP